MNKANEIKKKKKIMKNKAKQLQWWQTQFFFMQRAPHNACV